MAMITNIDPLELPRMKTPASALVMVLAACGAMTVRAQTKPDPATHAHPPQSVVAAPLMDVAAEAQPAVAVVERFGKALAAGDLKAVEILLDPAVLILESGGAERSRAEYMGHHAISDAKFLKSSHHQLKRRTARSAGVIRATVPA